MDVSVRCSLKSKKLENAGYDIGNLWAEKFLLADKYFGKNEKLFTINKWKILSEQQDGEFSESSFTGKVGEKEQRAVASVEGGPVDALYEGLQKLIATNFELINSVQLINYKVMIAKDQGVASSVRVYIEFKNEEEEWGTVGVSRNILKASLEAIEKGFRYFLIKHA